MTQSCKFCSETDNLENHHIIPRRLNGSDNSDNLVKVCPSCHSKLEELYDNQFFNKLGVKKSGSNPDTGYFLVECDVCGYESVSFKSSQADPLKCERCDAEKVLRKKKISEMFAELVSLEDFVDEESNDEYAVFFEYSEVVSGGTRAGLYPRGQKPMYFDTRRDAYEKAQDLLLRSWCGKAAVVSIEQVTRITDEVLEDHLSDSNDYSLDPKEDKILACLAHLENYLDADYVEVEEIGKASDFNDFKIRSVLDSLEEDSLVDFEEEKGYKIDSLEVRPQ